jgi:hypothetical protein
VNAILVRNEDILATKLRGPCESATVLTAQLYEGTAVNNKPTTPAQPAAPPQERPQERFMPGDPIPVPDAVEANTESTWAMFSDVARQPEPDFLDTVPASMMDEELAAIVRKNVE